MSFSGLPAEILYEIFGYLELPPLRLGSTSSDDTYMLPSGPAEPVFDFKTLLEYRATFALP